MAIKIVQPLLLLALWPLAGGAAPEQPLYHRLNSVQNLKAYALNFCIGEAFKDQKSVQSETIVAARAYFDFGHFNHDAYIEAAKLATSFLAKNYVSENGEKLVMLKCIDLFNSKELDALAKKYSRAQGRTR